MSVRHRRAAAVPTQDAAAEACYLRRSSGFIDEDQMHRVEVRLSVEPGLPAHGDVWPLLLAGEHGFYGMARPSPLKR